MSFLKSLNRLVLVMPLFVFISCGSQKPMVDDVQVSTSSVDGDIVLSLSADLSIGDVQLPSASFPIILPKIGKEIGTVSLVAANGGENQLVLDINVSEAANLELAAVRLPNGTVMPLIANNPVLKIPAGKVDLYVSLADGAQAIAVVIPIKSFDKIGAKTGTASLVPAFNKNGILGAAGVYTSRTPGQNGFVFVADISSKLGDISIPQLSASSQKSLQREEAQLDYTSLVPSRRAERRINKELLRMHRRKTRLKLR